MEIAETKEYLKLLVSGEADLKQCEEQWNGIVKKNAETNGGYDYINYLDLMHNYAAFLAEHNVVKALLLKLISINLEAGIVFINGNENFVQDEKIVEELRELGYRIDVTDSDTFAASINTGLRRAENLLLRMKFTTDELKEMIDENGDGDKVSFDSIMAFLYSQFPHVPEDITLSRYNEMVKILKQKNKRVMA